mmetsp:Transcript_54672/g.127489  ORF Transcript_54672/g.127489 Transcript_54672/m.127489 type:complete len:291 (+) Transcript_54672:1129-2001(+)
MREEDASSQPAVQVRYPAFANGELAHSLQKLCGDLGGTKITHKLLVVNLSFHGPWIHNHVLCLLGGGSLCLASIRGFGLLLRCVGHIYANYSDTHRVVSKCLRSFLAGRVPLHLGSSCIGMLDTKLHEDLLLFGHYHSVRLLLGACLNLLLQKLDLAAVTSGGTKRPIAWDLHQNRPGQVGQSQRFWLLRLGFVDGLPVLCFSLGSSHFKDRDLPPLRGKTVRLGLQGRQQGAVELILWEGSSFGALQAHCQLGAARLRDPNGLELTSTGPGLQAHDPSGSTPHQERGCC